MGLLKDSACTLSNFNCLCGTESGMSSRSRTWILSWKIRVDFVWPSQQLYENLCCRRSDTIRAPTTRRALKTWSDRQAWSDMNITVDCDACLIRLSKAEHGRQAVKEYFRLHKYNNLTSCSS